MIQTIKEAFNKAGFLVESIEDENIFMVQFGFNSEYRETISLEEAIENLTKLKKLLDTDKRYKKYKAIIVQHSAPLRIDFSF